MNWISLMQPLSLIKRLQIQLRATFVFFCATSVVQMYFLNTDLIVFVTYSVFNNTFKKLLQIYIFDKRWHFNKVR